MQGCGSGAEPYPIENIIPFHAEIQVYSFGNPNFPIQGKVLVVIGELTASAVIAGRIAKRIAGLSSKEGSGLEEGVNGRIEVGRLRTPPPGIRGDGGTVGTRENWQADGGGQGNGIAAGVVLDPRNPPVAQDR